MKSIKINIYLVSILMILATSVNANTIKRSSLDTVTPVIELYTSEGCSSCPPADDFLSSLGATIDDDFRAVPLAFHVDYWNYLGWKDPFSKSKFTKRQRWVAQVNKQSAIYTPEFVVDGKEALGGNQIVRYVEQANSDKAEVDIDLEVSAVNEEKIKLDIMFDNKVNRKNVDFYLALYENDLVRHVNRGENRGRTLKHNYVVRYWSPARSVDKGSSQEKLTLQFKRGWEKENMGLAVLVVDRRSGKTIQALRTDIGSLYQS